MRAWVGTPHIEEALGGRMLVGNRDDGYSVMMPIAGLSAEQMKWQMDSYLDNGCTCDSTMVRRQCFVHREVMVA